MKYKFYCPNFDDVRIFYAKDYLQNNGYEMMNKAEDSDFILLGVNPDKALLNYDLPIFAGNIRGNNIFDYTANEAFSIKNAFLTAEGAIALATCQSHMSLINANVLVIGYGRISKALARLLSNYTSNITVCARSESQLAFARSNCLETIRFNELTDLNRYQFVFNTVPHPVLNERELKTVNSNTLIIDLASFPGGVDSHYAKLKKIKLISARGLPAKYSPYDAGIIVGQTVDSMLREGVI